MHPHRLKRETMRKCYNCGCPWIDHTEDEKCLYSPGTLVAMVYEYIGWDDADYAWTCTVCHVEMSLPIEWESSPDMQISCTDCKCEHYVMHDDARRPG